MNYECGQIIGGFKVIDVSPLPELNATGLWVKHEKTGMEVFHIFCDDEENLFAFAFKTPSFNSTGVAHILEHSVLCGSKNFPLKDPFLQLSNQSVKTFLNAMTFSDKTVYPASTMVESDYFNLMAVYGDAVFFPLLQKWTFDQEAHRVEFGSDENLQISGVVYNEMKGNYSSFEGIVCDWSVRSLLQGTAYGVDSGGDPLEIPDLTYEQFVDFHKIHYHPSNCRLFLYGNIPLEKQLEFIQTKFLTYFEKNNLEKPFVSPNEITVGEPEIFDAPKTLTIKAPASDNETGSTVLLNWRVGDGDDGIETMELLFLSEILMGHDGSPLNVALLNSNLGEDISPASGISGEMKYSCFSVGLRGMKSADASKLEKLILDVLADLCKNGIPQNEIDSALLAAEFSNREVRRRPNGPFSLTLMRRSLRGWLHGKRPEETLINSRLFDVVKKRVLSDKNYLTTLIQKFFINNVQRTTLVVEPDSEFDEKRNLLEKKRIDSLFDGKSENEKAQIKEKIKQNQKELNIFQEKEEKSETLALIPHLKPKDLNSVINKIDMQKTQENNVVIFSHEDCTNDIAYVEVGFPVDVLEPADYRFLTFLSDCITSIGFDGKTWAEASAYCASVCGGISCDVHASSGVTWLKDSEYSEKKETEKYFDRSWIFFKIKMLNEKIEESIKILFSLINTGDFNDTQRLKTLLNESLHYVIDTVAPAGNHYASLRAKCKMNRYCAIDEILSGLTQLYILQDFIEMDLTELSKELVRVRDILIHSGAVVNITGTKVGIEKTKEALLPFISSMGELKPEFECRDEDFYNLTEIEDYSKEKTNKEVFVGNMQVGFAAMSTKASVPYTKFEACETVFAHWLKSSLLWEQIRTIGGAYGAFAYLDSSNLFSFASYRDPKPLETLDVFIDCLKRAKDFDFDESVVEKAITGSYSKIMQPLSPAARGSTGFFRQLYGIKDSDRQKRLEMILSINSKDLHETAVRMCNSFEKQSQNDDSFVYKAIISSKSINYTGKTVELPL